MFPPEDRRPGTYDVEAHEPHRCRPLTAEEYFDCEPMCDRDPSVDLSPWILISSETLHDLWPEVPWPKTIQPHAVSRSVLAPCPPRTISKLSIEEALKAGIKK